jgi:hypothetical protein
MYTVRHRESLSYRFHALLNKNTAKLDESGQPSQLQDTQKQARGTQSGQQFNQDRSAVLYTYISHSGGGNNLYYIDMGPTVLQVRALHITIDSELIWINQIPHRVTLLKVLGKATNFVTNFLLRDYMIQFNYNSHCLGTDSDGYLVLHQKRKLNQDFEGCLKVISVEELNRPDGSSGETTTHITVIFGDQNSVLCPTEASVNDITRQHRIQLTGPVQKELSVYWMKFGKIATDTTGTPPACDDPRNPDGISLRITNLYNRRMSNGLPSVLRWDSQTVSPTEQASSEGSTMQLVEGFDPRAATVLSLAIQPDGGLPLGDNALYTVRMNQSTLVGAHLSTV